MKELNDEVNHNDLIYYFKGNNARKRFDDFNNGIELFRKMKSGEIRLEEAKKLQNKFKSNLNEVSRARNKLEEQKMALENIKLFYESPEAFIKLFNDYFSIASEAKYKKIHGTGIPIMLANVACVTKVSNHSNLKILRAKKMFQDHK